MKSISKINSNLSFHSKNLILHVNEVEGCIASVERDPSSLGKVLPVMKDASCYVRQALSESIELDYFESHQKSHTFSLSDLYNYIFEQTKKIVEKNNHTLVAITTVDAEHKRVFAKQDIIIKILINLITSFSQLSTEAKITFKDEGENIKNSKLGDYKISFTITNSKAKLSKQQLKDILEPYYQIDNFNPGLRLSSCKSLVQLVNGKLSANYCEYEGTSIQFDVIVAKD